jgi:GT2 family glycosyltransferase
VEANTGIYCSKYQRKIVIRNQLVTFTLATYNRSQELEGCLDSILGQRYRPIEIVVVDNASTDATERIIKEKYNLPAIHYFKVSENKGCVEGRNIAIRNCKGNIIVTTDDDALLNDVDATQKIVDRFSQEKDLGLLSFKSINYHTKKIAREEFPHRDKSLNPDMEFETSYFVGVGYAVKKQVYDKVGLYPADFFFGAEELDLSFRIIDAGYKIMYFPQVTVLHKKSPAGRLSYNDLWLKRLENRIRVSIRNLPWRYVIGSTFCWSGYTLVNVRGDISIVIKAFWNIAKNMQGLIQQRKPIRKRTVKKLKQLKGRLLY